MSNVEPVPLETICTAEPGHEIQILPPRIVPLGGPRAMDVRPVSYTHLTLPTTPYV